MQGSLVVQLFCTLLTAGMLLTAGTGTAGAAAPALEVVVARGDTLNDLCATYLADPAQCPEIVRFNQLRDPDRIEPGLRLLIPYVLLKERPPQPSAGTVAASSGEVAVRRTSEGPWQPATEGAVVHQGDRVRTGKDGRARLAFADGTSLRLHPGTEITVRVLEERATGPVRSFVLGIGRLLASVRRSAGASFTIETTTAVAGSRGTEYSVSLPEDQIMRTAVEEGVVGVTAMGQEVLVNMGEGTIVRPGSPPEPPRKLLPPPAPSAPQERFDALPFELRFAAVEGAQLTRVVLSRDPAAEDVVLEQTVAGGDAVRVDALADGQYYVTVRSIDAGGIEGAASPPAALTMSLAPPVPESPPPAAPPAAEDRWTGYLLLLMAIVAALAF